MSKPLLITVQVTSPSFINILTVINSTTCSRTILLVMHYDSASAFFSFDKVCLFNEFSLHVLMSPQALLTQSFYLNHFQTSVSDGDVYEALINLKPNKAMGVDNIDPNIHKLDRQ